MRLSMHVETKPERNGGTKMSTTIKQESGNIPEKKFSTGSLVATVWQNQGKNKDGTDVAYRTVSFQRRYIDDKGEWQSTSSLRVNDLPKASLILQKAFEYVVMKEEASA